MSISYDDLRDAVAGTGVGIRAHTALEPLGGPGDKVFPPTYEIDGRAQYASEDRRLGTETVQAVVLDSVASQANRFELALLDAYRAEELSIPVVSVDFRTISGLERFDRISSLEASHRIFDAILRDSLLDDVLFRLSDVGRAVTEGSVKSAAALFRHSPTTLLFGGWDSTGPRGGLGNKFERAITSEIVGLGVVQGVKTSSRIDQLGIQKSAGPLYETLDRTWTLDKGEARVVKGEAVLVKGKGKAKGKGEAGNPSNVGLGNITPSIDAQAGGVTVKQILATTVISFAQLRRLRFPVDAQAALLDGDRRRVAEVAARTALASLGLAATVLAFEEGFDLRSRCVLAANGDLSFELLRRGSFPSSSFTLDRAQALELLAMAASAAADSGLPWSTDELLLKPTERLVELVRLSQTIVLDDGEE